MKSQLTPTHHNLITQQISVKPLLTARSKIQAEAQQMQEPIQKRIVVMVPQRLKRQAAAKAAAEGRTLKDVLIELLSAWTQEPATSDQPHPIKKPKSP